MSMKRNSSFISSFKKKEIGGQNVSNVNLKSKYKKKYS